MRERRRETSAKKQSTPQKIIIIRERKGDGRGKWKRGIARFVQVTCVIIYM